MHFKFDDDIKEEGKSDWHTGKLKTARGHDYFMDRMEELGAQQFKKNIDILANLKQPEDWNNWVNKFIDILANSNSWRGMDDIKEEGKSDWHNGKLKTARGHYYFMDRMEELGATAQ